MGFQQINSSIIDSFATGTTASNGVQGGLLAATDGTHTITNSYFTGVDNGYGTRVANADVFKNQSHAVYNNWTFDSTKWDFVQGHDLPKLSFQGIADPLPPGPSFTPQAAQAVRRAEHVQTSDVSKAAGPSAPFVMTNVQDEYISTDVQSAGLVSDDSVTKMSNNIFLLTKSGSEPKSASSGAGKTTATPQNSAAQKVAAEEESSSPQGGTTQKDSSQKSSSQKSSSHRKGARSQKGSSNQSSGHASRAHSGSEEESPSV